MFPALKALRYSDLNVLAMDKIYFFVKRVNAAIEISSSLLNDKKLFGCPDNCVITGCEEELNKVFGKSKFISERQGNYHVYYFL